MTFLKQSTHRVNSVRWLLVLLILSLKALGCNLKNSDFTSPEGYDLNNPVTIKLPLELDEISGVAYYAKDTSVMAINDEYGRLYKIFLNRPNIIHTWPFTKGADFEDVSLIDSNFYVLKSNGNIICFRFITRDSIYFAEYTFPFGTQNEFEILYFDSSRQKIMLICKDCESDKKSYLSTFSFDPWTLEYEASPFQIDVTKIAAAIGEKKIRFKPSAAAINPVTRELYIISAVNDLLVIADDAGRTKKVFKIDGGLFKQPEGITFSPQGTMIISNEAADIGVANILIFPYQKTGRKTP